MKQQRLPLQPHTPLTHNRQNTPHKRTHSQRKKTPLSPPPKTPPFSEELQKMAALNQLYLQQIRTLEEDNANLLARVKDYRTREEMLVEQQGRELMRLEAQSDELIKVVGLLEGQLMDKEGLIERMRERYAWLEVEGQKVERLEGQLREANTEV